MCVVHAFLSTHQLIKIRWSYSIIYSKSFQLKNHTQKKYFFCEMFTKNHYEEHIFVERHSEKQSKKPV